MGSERSKQFMPLQIIQLWKQDQSLVQYGQNSVVQMMYFITSGTLWMTNWVPMKMNLQWSAQKNCSQMGLFSIRASNGKMTVEKS